MKAGWIRFVLLFTVSSSLLFLSACTSHVKQAQVDPAVKSRLTAEILEMDKKDQLYRWQLLFGEPDLAIVDSLSKLSPAQYVKHLKKKGTPAYGLTDSQYNSIQRLQDSLDKANQDRILQIYHTYGWPGKELVGSKASGVVGILMLHFPDSLMVALYPKLKKEYKRGNVSGSNLAHMWDKHLLLNRQPLLYGMFKHTDTATKTILPPMIRDIQKTNKARKKLALPPLEQYRLAGDQKSS